MSDGFTKIEIQRLERLLDSRREEYEVFGMTPDDTAKDAEIRLKIINLKEQLTP